MAEPLGEQLTMHPGPDVAMADALPAATRPGSLRQQIASERQLEKEAADAARKEGVERKQRRSAVAYLVAYLP